MRAYDRRAVRILFDTYWSASGWRPEAERTTPPEDLAYAKAKGVMFDPRPAPHDGMVTAAAEIAGRTDPAAVSDAFLASLGSRELAYRSALGSFATARWLPVHRFETRRYAHACRTCGEHRGRAGEDLSVLAFERLKWGGVRHRAATYAWFDLTEFAKLPPARPSGADRDVLRRILEVASSQPPEARPVHLEKAIAGLFPANASERRGLLAILGYCGILQPAGHGSFFQDYPEFDGREEPPEHRNDWPFPLVWWRGRDGVSARALEFYFPGLRARPQGT